MDLLTRRSPDGPEPPRKQERKQPMTMPDGTRRPSSLRRRRRGGFGVGRVWGSGARRNGNGKRRGDGEAARGDGGRGQRDFELMRRRAAKRGSEREDPTWSGPCGPKQIMQITSWAKSGKAVH